MRATDFRKLLVSTVVFVVLFTLGVLQARFAAEGVYGHRYTGIVASAKIDSGGSYMPIDYTIILSTGRPVTVVSYCSGVYSQYDCGPSDMTYRPGTSVAVFVAADGVASFPNGTATPTHIISAALLLFVALMALYYQLRRLHAPTSKSA
jgi:hypothetical protein